MSAIFKRPEIKSVDFCVDENIWGHRLYDEQLPHLTVLEFLGALGSNLDKPLRPYEGLAGAFRFQPQRQIRLRGLLFNNPYVESISESKHADEEKWRQWFERFAQGSTGNGDGVDDMAHRAIMNVRKAMLYDKLMSSADAAAKKVANTPTKVVRAGTGDTGSLDKRTVAFNHLAKSGSVKAGAAVFESLL